MDDPGWHHHLFVLSAEWNSHDDISQVVDVYAATVCIETGYMMTVHVRHDLLNFHFLQVHFRTSSHWVKDGAARFDLTLNAISNLHSFLLLIQRCKVYFCVTFS